MREATCRLKKRDPEEKVNAENSAEAQRRQMLGAKERKKREVAAGRRAFIRLSDHSASTFGVVHTSNSIRLFKLSLNFIKTWPGDKD